MRSYAGFEEGANELRSQAPNEPSIITSLPTKVRVFSDIFRDRKTKVAYFTSQFLNNYKLRPYIIQAHTIKEARLSLEGVQIKFRI